MTAPTPTPPCLGEREAVARTIDPYAWECWEEIQEPHYGSYGLSGEPEGRLEDSTCARWQHAARGAGMLPKSLAKAAAIIAEHIGPLRTENETLRAERDVRAMQVTNIHRALGLDQNQGAYARIDELNARALTAEAERAAAIARAEEAERRVGDLSATLTAWEGAFGTIQSHLQDRIAMNDPARPDVYLRIVEGSVGELPRISRQIYAATQYRSQSTQAYANRVDLENETLTAKLAQAEGEIATIKLKLEASRNASQ